MGLFSLIGSIFGGGSAKKNAQKASEAQVAAANTAIGDLRRQFDATQANLAPWLSAGNSALSEQMKILGLGPLPGMVSGYGGGTFNIDGSEATPVDRYGEQAAAIANLKNSPLYSSIYNNGEEAILANASATGGLRGGNTQNSLARFGGDTLSGVLGQYLAQLGGLSGTGNQTATNIGQFGANTADQVSGLQVGIGNAQAGNYLARGRIDQGIWREAGSWLDDAAKTVAGGMGGGGAGGGFSLGKLF